MDKFYDNISVRAKLKEILWRNNGPNYISIDTAEHVFVMSDELESTIVQYTRNSAKYIPMHTTYIVLAGVRGRGILYYFRNKTWYMTGWSNITQGF